MDIARKGEIAMLVLQHWFRKEASLPASDILQKIAGAAIAMGVPVPEAAKFAAGIAQAYIDERRAEHVTWSNDMHKRVSALVQSIEQDDGCSEQIREAARRLGTATDALKARYADDAGGANPTD